MDSPLQIDTSRDGAGPLRVLPLAPLPLGSLPEFPDAVPHRAHACTPRELYGAIFLELEDHVHFLEPAFEFVRHALDRAATPSSSAGVPRVLYDRLAAGTAENAASEGLAGDDAARELADTLIRWARTNLPAVPALARGSVLPVLAAHEFAPAGLADGAWLRGSVLANRVETPLGMTALRQLMLRFGDPATREPYSLRYASLLQSLGISPDSVQRGVVDGEACADVSFEHALLGVGLGLFASTFGPEIAGFNLWMTAVGPCPLLERWHGPLRERGACVRYFDLFEREALATLARRAVGEVAAEVDAPPNALWRVARGFVAAQHSYLRWQRAVLAAETRVGESAGSSGASRTDPPPESVESSTASAEPFALAGHYTAPHDLGALEAFAYARYGQLSNQELYFCFANSDLFPTSALFAKAYVHTVLHKLEHVFANDPRLDSQHPPPYSEALIARLVAAQHDKNVQSRKPRDIPAAELELGGDGKPEVVQVFDGSWLQGFADVGRAGFEEYGWLFRIYASEHGDGDLAWNHCQIFRKAFADAGVAMELPKTDRRLYDVFEIGAAAVVTLAVALNTRVFMPEVLGINLGIEATGVGGMYLDQWKGAVHQSSPWRALAWRLHNSIDNYADGHTKWSLAAVQSFMQRVKAASPDSVERQWQRVWRLWRCQDILTHGSPTERGALAEHLGLRNLAPTG